VPTGDHGWNIGLKRRFSCFQT